MLDYLEPVIFISVRERRLDVARGSKILECTLLRRLLAAMRRALSIISLIKSRYFSLQDISVSHLQRQGRRNMLLFCVKVRLKLRSIAYPIFSLLRSSFVVTGLCNHLTLELTRRIFGRSWLCDMVRGWEGRPAEKCLVLHLKAASRFT